MSRPLLAAPQTAEERAARYAFALRALSAQSGSKSVDKKLDSFEQLMERLRLKEDELTAALSQQRDAASELKELRLQKLRFGESAQLVQVCFRLPPASCSSLCVAGGGRSARQVHRLRGAGGTAPLSTRRVPERPAGRTVLCLLVFLARCEQLGSARLLLLVRVAVHRSLSSS